MKCYCNSLKKVLIKLFSVLLIFTQVVACSPPDNRGDLSVAASGGAAFSTSFDNTQMKISAIYGSEYGHQNKKKSDISYGNLNLLVSLFIFLPNETSWYYAGGGNGKNPLYYRLIYTHTNWLLNPYSLYAPTDIKGDVDLTKKMAFSWEFDGKKRAIKIAGKTYPISSGDYVLVKIDKDWKPDVWVGEEGFQKLNILTESRNEILKCFATIKKGIGALGKCK